jgi:competence protein ComEC
MNLEKLKENFGFILVGALFFVAIFVWLAVFAKAQGGNLTVHFFDVGQGKAIFIETPEGRQILIDGGPDNSILEKLSNEMAFFDRDIDLLILTHPDSDHLSGLIEVLERYSVGKIIEAGIEDPSAEYQVWHNTIKEKNIPVIFALAGQQIKIGDDFLMELLFPGQDLSGRPFSNTNSTSLVSRLDYGAVSFLFTGDAEAATESYLAGSGADINADVLDVSHHGSKNSTGRDFLEAVSPQTAVIQAGVRNRYGHPAQETLERLKNIKVWRTDICRDVSVISDGEGFEIKSGC